MHPNRYTLSALTALGLALAAPLSAQDTGATEAPATEAPATEPAPAPAADAPSTEPAPAADSPATETAPADPEVPATEEPAPAAEAPVEPAPAVDAAPEAPETPNITVVKEGDWEVGCLTGTDNCEMQQVAADPQGNPVLLVRVIKLPEGSDAPALAIFNTPLGTLLPPGLGFQVDSGPTASLPFEWCVQEGCVVRLGMRDPDVAALKRGNNVKLTVISIADAQKPVELSLSLSGFTAAYDSLTPPPSPPASPASEPQQ